MHCSLGGHSVQFHLSQVTGGYTIYKKLLNLRNGVEKFPALNLIKWEVRIDDR